MYLNYVKYRLTDEHDVLSAKYKQVITEKDGIRGEYELKLKKLKEQIVGVSLLTVFSNFISYSFMQLI